MAPPSDSGLSTREALVAFGGVAVLIGYVIAAIYFLGGK